MAGGPVRTGDSAAFKNLEQDPLAANERTVMTSPASADIRAAARFGNLFGIITIILGVLAMTAPLASGMAVATLVGIFLLLAGVTQVVFALRAPSFREGFLVLLFGGIAALAGATMVARPLFGLASITMVLVIYFLVDGLSTVASGIRLRPARGSGWMIFGGATSILLGVLLLRNWPLSGAWAVGVLVGIRLLIRGWSMIALSVVGREVASTLEENER